MADAQYTNSTVRGRINSVTPKVSKNGRDFAEVVIDGQEFTSWSAGVTQQAEMYLNGEVEAVVRQKEGSSFWSIQLLTPVHLQDPGAPPNRAGRLDGQHTREICINYDISSRGDSTDPQIILASARLFEQYLLGEDLDMTGEVV